MAQKNLALNRPIISSDIHYSSYTPESAVDGNLDSNVGFLKSDAGKVTLTIELEKIYLIQIIKLKQLQFGGYRCKNFTIEVSTDNIKYAEIYTGILMDNDELQEFSFANAYRCKYLKLNIIDNYIASNKSNGISEIEIYCANAKILLKQNNQYYTLKSEFYKDGRFTPLILEGRSNPNTSDFENFGFDDIGLLTQDITIGVETFKPKDKLKLIGDGKFDIVMKEIE